MNASAIALSIALLLLLLNALIAICLMGNTINYIDI